MKYLKVIGASLLVIAFIPFTFHTVNRYEAQRNLNRVLKGYGHSTNVIDLSKALTRLQNSK